MSSPFRLGIFVVVALLMLGAAVFLIGDKQLLFHRTYRLNPLSRMPPGWRAAPAYVSPAFRREP
jgi:hypothetical protein